MNGLTDIQNRRFKVSKDNWIRCPKCRTKLFSLNDDGISRGVVIKCKRCKNILEINVDRNRENENIKVV